MESDLRWHSHYPVLGHVIPARHTCIIELVMPPLLLPGACFPSICQRAPASHQLTNISYTDLNELPLSSNTTKMSRTRISVLAKTVGQEHPRVALRKFLVSVLGRYLNTCGLGLLVPDP